MGGQAEHRPRVGEEGRQTQGEAKWGRPSRCRGEDKPVHGRMDRVCGLGDIRGEGGRGEHGQPPGCCLPSADGSSRCGASCCQMTFLQKVPDGLEWTVDPPSPPWGCSVEQGGLRPAQVSRRPDRVAETVTASLPASGCSDLIWFLTRMGIWNVLPRTSEALPGGTCRFGSETLR